jgi:hypothetical protein
MFAAGRRGGTGLGSAGLEPVIQPEALRHALHATGRVNPRACKLIPEVVLWVVLAMGLFTELPIRQIFKHARRLLVGEDSPHRARTWPRSIATATTGRMTATASWSACSATPGMIRNGSARAKSLC